MRKVKQNTSEKVQVYAERMLDLGQDQNATQRQLTDYSIRGLNENYLNMKIMRENSQISKEAVAVTTRQQNLRKRFKHRTEHKITMKGYMCPWTLTILKIVETKNETIRLILRKLDL